MSPDRWQEIERVYHQALEQEPGARGAFLAQACDTDDELRREVESLLAQDGSSNSGRLRRNPLDEPAGDGITGLLDPTETHVCSGTHIGSYVIEAPLGEGGMGVVYRGRDTKLNRPVAIKFLSSDLADASARRRFQREAQTASGLNHPHIVTVYDADEFEGRQYLVTEFVDGGTLSDWAKEHKRTWKESVELLTGVADGLSSAHQAGMVHRDVKPANILVAKNGYAKLADFGLAKLAENGDIDITRTLTEGRTKPGMIIGTIAYMSPEQACGKPLDARSDIFSFGVVLYEMLAGKRPFSGATDLEVLQTVIHGEPTPLSEDLPSAVRMVVGKALEKEPAARYQDMRDMVVDLKRVMRQSEIPADAPSRSGLKDVWKWAAVGVALAAGLIAWRIWPALVAGTSPQIRSIAVLPLQNLSGDPSQEFLSDGATEELISSLGQLHAFEKVISHTSVMRYKGLSKAMPDIGKELGVDAILEGSIQRTGGRIRIRARLIQADMDKELWAKDYDRDGGDVLGLQSEVAAAIAQELRAQVTPGEQTRLARSRNIAPGAQEAYLLGRYHVQKLNETDLAQSVESFTKAIQLQPDYAAAYAGLARAWTERGVWGAAGFRAAEAPARGAALKALELDPNLSEAHTALGLIKCNYDWDWAGSEREFKRAIELDPNQLDAHLYYGGALLMALGRFPEAIAEADRAVALDPMSSLTRSDHARILFRARKYREAVPYYQRAIELDSQNYGAYTRLAELYERTGSVDEALAFVEQALKIRGAAYVKSADIGRLYARLGRRQEALKIAQALGASPPTAGSSGIARIYFALGDKDQGFLWLKRAFDERDLVVFVKMDPNYDEVRSDPRFQTLVARLKIPD